MSRKKGKKECWLRPIIIWDTETTGLSHNRHRIVEIALMELRFGCGLRKEKSFSTFVSPINSSRRCVIPDQNSQSSQLRPAPSFVEAWPKINEFVETISAKRGRPILVAHNLSFDSRFLSAELLRIGEPLPDWDYACSLRDVAHIVWPGEPASLASLVEKLKIDHNEPHRALPDVRATAEVLACADDVLRSSAIVAGESPGSPGSYVRELLEHAATRRKYTTEGTKRMIKSNMNITPSNCNNDHSSSSSENRERNEDYQKNTDEKNHDNEESFVYITPSGFLWHIDRACKKLDSAMAILRKSSPPHGRLPCFICTKEQE